MLVWHQGRILRNDANKLFEVADIGVRDTHAADGIAHQMLAGIGTRVACPILAGRIGRQARRIGDAPFRDSHGQGEQAHVLQASDRPAGRDTW